MPSAVASASSSRTCAAWRCCSSASRVSSASRPSSAPSRTSTSRSPTASPSVKYARSSRSLASSCRPWAAARWISWCASKVLAPHGPVEAEVQALGRGGGRHRVEHLLRLGPGGAVLGGEAVGVAGGVGPLGRGARRRARVQLEALPLDDDLVAVGEARQGRLEAPLADVAPRTHDVRPDLDLHADLPLVQPSRRPTGRPPHGIPAAGLRRHHRPDLKGIRHDPADVGDPQYRLAARAAVLRLRGRPSRRPSTSLQGLGSEPSATGVQASRRRRLMAAASEHHRGVAAEEPEARSRAPGPRGPGGRG